MKRDNTIDKTIIQILNDTKIIQKYIIKDIKTKNKKEELHFRGISKAVAELYRPITDRILDLHLDTLVKWKIIERDKRPIFNHATFYRLVKNTKWAFEIGMPIKVKGGRGGEFFLLHEKQGDKNKKVYLLLMSLFTIGFTVPQHLDNFSKNVRPGDICFGNKSYRFSDPLPGISINNLFHKYQDSANGWRFRYLTFKNHTEVKWYLKKLMEFEPPIIKPINEIEWIKRERLEKNLEWPIAEKSNDKDEETIRYGIADRQLYEFLERCIVLLGSTERLMEHIWKYKRKPKYDEIEWYKSIYGKAYTDSIFIEINQNRNWLKKLIGKTTINQRKKVEDDVKAAHKIAEQTGDFKSLEYKTACMIEDYLAGNNIVNRIRKDPQIVHQRYFGMENYEDVYEKYGIIASAIKEIAYPHFITELSLKDE